MEKAADYTPSLERKWIGLAQGAEVSRIGHRENSGLVPRKPESSDVKVNGDSNARRRKRQVTL